MADLRLEEVCSGIFNVRARSPHILGDTFMRPQEYYENPVYRGKKGFTHQDIQNWWKTTGEGEKHKYWAWFESFNFPSESLEPFYAGDFNPLTDREQALLQTLNPLREQRKRFYVIGTKTNARLEDVKHEAAHGKYFTSPEYKRQVLEILKTINPKDRKKLDRYLLEGNGYSKAVLNDEVHAWIMTEEKRYLERAGIKFEEISAVRESLNHLYDRTFTERRNNK